MGVLLAAVDVDGLNEDKIAELDLDLGRGNDENGQALCPPEPPAAVKVNKEALFASLYGGSSDGSNIAAAGAVAALAASSARYKDAGGNAVSVDLNVVFEFNSSVISTNFDGEIGNSAAVIRDNPGLQAIVEGHSDSTGTPEYNKRLSERRAASVRDMLINEHGISPDQVKAVGFGLERPVADNATKEGRERNRRVELVLRAAN